MTYQSAASRLLTNDQVAIAITHGIFGVHLGVVFFDEQDSPKLLHLALHKRLLIDDYPPQTPWAVSLIELGKWSAVQARALLCGMSQKYAGAYKEDSIHYGINLFAGIDSIQVDGQYTPTEDCDGYTCSSIVASAFGKIGFPLVDLKSWESKEINRAWGRAIVCMLTAFGTPPDHVALVEKNNNGLRLRPEEVAAAGEIAQSMRPVKYGDIQQRADDVFKEMLAVCGQPQSLGDSPVKPCADAYHAELRSRVILELVNCIRRLTEKCEPE